MPNKDSYIKLRKSLDSLSSVSLAEYNLLETEIDKQEFTDFVTKQVEQFLKEVAVRHSAEWRKSGHKRAKQFTEHAKSLEAEMPTQCPPGFHEVDGICVPI